MSYATASSWASFVDAWQSFFAPFNEIVIEPIKHFFNPVTESFKAHKRKIVLYSCLVAAILAFLLNLVVTIVVSLRFNKAEVQRPTYVANPSLFKGDCSYASKLIIGLHAAINAISTILLACSNLCMQILLAPTRKELDSAHANKKYLDIGIPSMRNFRFVDWKRQVAWLLLVFSSLPLHLLYNSAVYITKPANEISMFIVTPEFSDWQSARVNVNKAYDAFEWRKVQNLTGLEVSHKKHRRLINQRIDGNRIFGFNEGQCGNNNCDTVKDRLRRDIYTRNVSATECLTTYSDPFRNGSDIIFIADYDYLSHEMTTAANATNTLLFSKYVRMQTTFGFWADYDWLCGGTNSFDCRRPSLWKANPDIIKDWNIFGWRIQRCMYSETQLNRKCAVRFSRPIMIAVCAANLCKLLGIAYCVFRFARSDEKDAPVITIGDAIASFLSEEDDATKGLALVNKEQFRRDHAVWTEKCPRPWLPKTRTWFASAPLRRWLWSFVPFIMVVAAGSGFVGNALHIIEGRAGSSSYFRNMSFGKVDPAGFAVLGMDSNVADPDTKSLALYSFAFFANIWQLLLSIVYTMYNALLTYLCVEAEWQSYATKKKALRVTIPKNKQRSTYFISLPARFILPLLISFTAMHITLSQGLFVAVVETYAIGGDLSSGMPFLVQNGIALIITVAIGMGISLVLLFAGFQKHKGCMPLGATCSAVLSAACHPPTGDSKAAISEIQWGAVGLDKWECQILEEKQDAVGVETSIPQISLAPSDRDAQQSQIEVEPSMTDEPLELGDAEARIGFKADGHCCFTTQDIVTMKEGQYFK